MRTSLQRQRGILERLDVLVSFCKLNLPSGRIQTIHFQINTSVFNTYIYIFALNKYFPFTNLIPSTNICEIWRKEIRKEKRKLNNPFKSLYTHSLGKICLDSTELLLNAYGLLKAQSHTHQWKNSSSSSQFRAFYIVKQWRSDKFLTEDKMFSFWFCSKPAGYLIWSVIHQEQQEEVQKKMILLV